MKAWLLQLSRRSKRTLQIFTDIFLIWMALWLAFAVRLGFSVTFELFNHYLALFIAAPVIAIPIFIRMGMYRAVLRYLGKEALINIAKAVSFSAIVFTIFVYLTTANKTGAVVPRSMVLNYWCISLLLLGGLRLFMRQYFLGGWFSQYDRYLPLAQAKVIKRVAVYGAGSAGNQLVAALRLGEQMLPVAFIDDDDSIANRSIAGLKVYKPKHIQQLLDETQAVEILLAIPSVARSRRREIITELAEYPVPVRSVPGFMDLASGKVKVQDIQDVDIADLLGRDAVPPMPELLDRCIKNKVVLVTGAGGSIGSELCRQIVQLGASTLVLYEHSEYNLYAIQKELENTIGKQALSVQLIPILGSIRNDTRLLEVMRSWQVQTVYHAAAYKHVPMVEFNISEGILNNVMGTLNTAQMAVLAGVEHFVLISTDKAVRPTNVMGSTKRLAELVLQAIAQEKFLRLFQSQQEVKNNTRFTMVRFGNVLGSSGSVIPLFREQIKRGGPITVTHPNITRYFMTIPEAAQLVIQAGSMGQGGDVFVLDMGEPVKIADLAQKMIDLAGLSVRDESTPMGDIAIEYSGLRPGEKLYEELLIGDNVTPTEHSMIMRANEKLLTWAELSVVLRALDTAAKTGIVSTIRRLLCETVEGYQPQSEVVDLLYTRQHAHEPAAIDSTLH